MCHPDITVLVDWAQNIKLFTHLILTYFLSLFMGWVVVWTA